MEPYRFAHAALDAIPDHRFPKRAGTGETNSRTSGLVCLLEAKGREIRAGGPDSIVIDVPESARTQDPQRLRKGFTLRTLRLFHRSP